jgi:nitroreductase
MRKGSEQEGNPEMDVFEAIRTRRSIRKYRSKPIPNEKLNMILEAARLAPSAGNRQPWRFIIIQDADRKKEVAQAADDQTFLSDAATIVVAVGDPDASIRWHEKDSMIALEHIVLASTALGYGTCWIGAFDEEALKRLLKIPTRMKVVALLPIGIPDETPSPKPRKKPSEIFFKEQWQTPYASQTGLVKPRRTAEPHQR